MKGKELEKIIDKYVRSIEKLCRRIPGSFAIEDIHDLRVDYKRLRAFIRLCCEEPQTKDLQIPDSLRDVYKAAGEVRDHQLFIAKIILFAKVQYALPGFTKCLQQQLFKTKEELVKKIEKVDWDKTHKNIKDELPKILHDTAIRQFVNRKVAGIHILLLAADREEDLHSMRKNLKDLLHVTRVFDHDWIIPFPFPAWKTEKPISDMADKLGDFNDECITLKFLRSECLACVPPEETDNITKWHQMQQKQIEECKKQLLHQVKNTHLQSV
jgi:CHAD domain-containing protein